MFAQRPCLSQNQCFDLTCQYLHPNQICAQWSDCRIYDCQNRHGMSRTRLCLEDLCFSSFAFAFAFAFENLKAPMISLRRMTGKRLHRCLRQGNLTLRSSKTLLDASKLIKDCYQGNCRRQFDTSKVLGSSPGLGTRREQTLLTSRAASPREGERKQRDRTRKWIGGLKQQH